jgi:CRISPR system Cascade subunit CasE
MDSGNGQPRNSGRIEMDNCTFAFQITLPVFPVIKWATTHGAIRLETEDLGYVSHALLESFYGGAAPRVFSYEVNESQIRIIGYSPYDLSRFDLVNHRLVKSLENPNIVKSTSLPSQWHCNQRVGFEIRVCPTIRQDRDGDRATSRERDAYLVAIEKKSSEDHLSREKVYLDWLNKRLFPSARISEENIRAVMRQFRILSLQRRGHPGNETSKRPLVSMKFPEAVLTGELVIDDPVGFNVLLSKGIGRHKAFGFGMLKLSPA